MKYYSEKLDKLFESEEQLKSAEKEHEEAEALKVKKAEEKKADASLVQETFKQKNAAEKEYTRKCCDARIEYNTKITAARKEYLKAVEEAKAVLKPAEEAYSKALNDFISRHPEGYHLTLHDGDDVVTLSGQVSTNTDEVEDEFDLMNSFFNNWLKRIK